MPSAGKLWAKLQAAGIEKSAITKVIFTHGHPDHLWGVLDEFDELALPDAAFYVAGAEWDFWHGERAVRGLPPERRKRSVRSCGTDRASSGDQAAVHRLGPPTAAPGPAPLDGSAFSTRGSRLAGLLYQSFGRIFPFSWRRISTR